MKSLNEENTGREKGVIPNKRSGGRKERTLDTDWIQTAERREFPDDGKDKPGNWNKKGRKREDGKSKQRLAEPKIENKGGNK